jgi:hypothetical protein
VIVISTVLFAVFEGLFKEKYITARYTQQCNAQLDAILQRQQPCVIVSRKARILYKNLAFSTCYGQSIDSLFGCIQQSSADSLERLLESSFIAEGQCEVQMNTTRNESQLVRLFGQKFVFKGKICILVNMLNVENELKNLKVAYELSLRSQELA